MKYGLLGRRLDHSFSKEIHALLGNGEYCLIEKEPEELESFFRTTDFLGLNVTVPYKQTVIPYLDALSPEAKEVGAVNTVVRRNGRLVGYNTDCFGLSYLLSSNGQSLSGKRVAILGSGGTSRTAQFVAGQSGARSVTVVSRTPQNGMISYASFYAQASSFDVVINTTPCGMFPDNDGCPIDLSFFPTLSFVCDVIYHPLRSRLVCEARKKGISAFGGLEMLCAQAAETENLFSFIPSDGATIERLYQQIVSRKENVVLIGMPSCGKTSVGERLAKATQKQFRDTDEMFERTYGLSPAEEIRKNGEKSFREKEAQIVNSVSRETGCVIATGGGTVLSEENVLRLKQNGHLVFLDRPLSLLTASPDRPLSATREQIESLYRERISVYRKVSDVIVQNDGTLEDAVSKLLAGEGMK